MGVLRQAFFAVMSCMVCFSVGLMYSWPSSTFKLFTSANTTLHRPMTEIELSLFGSLSAVGAVICVPIAGLLMDVIGKNNCIFAACLSQVISWTLVVASNRVEIILIAIFCSGAGGFVFQVVSIYVAEFCQESIRGTLASLPMVFYAFGMLISFLLGGFLEYKMMNYLCLSMSIGSLVIISFLKESPLFLMKKGRGEDAMKSISFFRGVSRDSKEMQQELDTIRRALNPDIDEVFPDTTVTGTPEEENLKPEPTDTPKETLSKWQFIKKSRSTQRAVFIIALLISLSLNQGFIVLQVYAKPLFEEAIPNMSATICCVLLAIATVLAGFLTAYLVDTIGRRKLLMYASVVAGLNNIMVAIQLQRHLAPHWVTAIALYGFIISSAAGAGSVPFILLAEVLLPEVRSIISMLMVEWAWLNSFIILFIINPVITAIGVGAVFYIFACFCILGAVFTYFYVPETMGLPIDTIQLLFTKNSKRRRVPCTSSEGSVA